MRQVYSDKCLYEEKIKISNNLNLQLKELEEKINKLKFIRKKEITKIRAETENGRIIEKINATKGSFLKRVNKIDEPLLRKKILSHSHKQTLKLIL